VNRFAWLQFRKQAALAAGGLLAVAVLLVVTGPSLVHLYDTTVANCASQHDCSTATTAFTDTDGPLQVFLDFLILLVPLIVGMFWGAPLVSRDLETGTFRLAWTQGVSRTRWLGRSSGSAHSEHRGRRAAQPHGELVVERARRGAGRPLQPPRLRRP
jgi:hypothetical protein